MSNLGEIKTGYLTANELLSREDYAEICSESFRKMLTLDPYVKKDDPVAFFSANGDKIVSKMLLIPHDARCAGKSVKWFWGQDFYTDPNMRGKGIGTALLKMMFSELRSRDICFGAYAMSDASKKIFNKCGLVDLGRFPRFILLLNSGPIVDRFFKVAFLKNIIRWTANLFLLSFIFFSQRKLSLFKDMYYREKIGLFDERVDELLSKYEPILWMHRSSKALNWKLLHAIDTSKDTKRYDAFYIKRKNDDTLRGYFISKFGVYNNFGGRPYKNVKIFTVVDFFTDTNSENDLFGMISQIVQEAKIIRADVIEIVSNDRKIKNILKRFLFLQIGGYDFCYSFTEKSPLKDDFCKKAENWWAAMGESDAFFF